MKCTQCYDQILKNWKNWVFWHIWFNFCARIIFSSKTQAVTTCHFKRNTLRLSPKSDSLTLENILKTISDFDKTFILLKKLKLPSMFVHPNNWNHVIIFLNPYDKC